MPAQLSLRSLGNEHFQVRATSSDNSGVRIGRWIGVVHWQNQPYVQNRCPGLNSQEEQSGECQGCVQGPEESRMREGEGWWAVYCVILAMSVFLYGIQLLTFKAKDLHTVLNS